MRRNCNLTLRLVPPSSHDHLRQEPKQPSDQVLDFLGLDANQNLNENQSQQLTIFYNGNISVCDVTDFQARAIIKLASEEIEEKRHNTTPLSELSSPFMLSPSLSSSPSPSPSQSPSQGGLSMKKSLQRFLQKRKHRLQATSPYHRS